MQPLIQIVTKVRSLKLGVATHATAHTISQRLTRLRAKVTVGWWHLIAC